MLLIDEVDATLHASAQDRLLALLCKESKELGLQVVATTHSLRTLRTAFQSPLRRQTHVLRLDNQDGRVVLKQCRKYEEIEADLSLEPTLPSKKGPPRVSVILEDQEAKQLFHCICGSKLRNYITVENLQSLDAGNLKNLGNLSSRVPSLQNLILLADGDMAATWDNPPKNLLALPGGKRPETLIYDHLYPLPASDPFWESCSPGYSRQVAIAKHGGKKGSADSKEWAKTWFDRQSKYWGNNNKKVFQSWVASNKPQCLEFTKAFIKLVGGRYRGEIPKDTTQRALNAYT